MLDPQNGDVVRIDFGPDGIRPHLERCTYTLGLPLAQLNGILEAYLRGTNLQAVF